MPRLPRPWFRFYTEAMYDPKLRELPPSQRWVWIAILSAARKSCAPGVLLASASRPLSDAALADIAAVPVREVRKALARMEADGMIHQVDGSGAWAVTKWRERQFESDDVTERTRKHRSREQGRNVPKSFVGTPPETETEKEPPLPPLTTHEGPVENGSGGGIVEAAVELAAKRYGEAQVARGKGDNAAALGRWWLQHNADDARIRAKELLAEYALTLTQLADVLLDPNVTWLRHTRRPMENT